MKCQAIFAVVITLLVTLTVCADIPRGFDDELEITDVYTDLDEWLDTAPEVIVIDFTEYIGAGEIDDEYADLGVNFVSGFYTLNNASACLDEWCLDGNSNFIAMEFDQTFNVIGVLFPGVLRFELYLDGEIVGWTENVPVTGTVGQFGGLITDVEFNQVLVIQDAGEVQVDNLYFSFLEVPAPAAALPLLALAAIAGRRRRR